MKLISLVVTASLLAMPLVGFGQQIRLKSKTIKKSQNGHSFVLHLAKKPFERDRHDLSKITENIIDGKEIFGTDSSMPREEFSEFSLTIDGDAVSIPPETYARFYDPTLGYEAGNKYVDAFWDENYDCVFVYMNGSDGAGAYSVTWVLNKNGEHTLSLIPIYEMYFDFNDSR